MSTDIISLWQLNSITTLSLLSVHCQTSFLQKDSTGIFNEASDAIFLYPSYQLLGKHQIFCRINFLKAARFSSSFCALSNNNSVIFGSCSPSVPFPFITEKWPLLCQQPVSPSVPCWVHAQKKTFTKEPALTPCCLPGYRRQIWGAAASPPLSAFKSHRAQHLQNKNPRKTKAPLACRGCESSAPHFLHPQHCRLTGKAAGKLLQKGTF